MSIEYTPVGIACNLQCDYCYQQPMRDAGNITSPINWEAARKILERHNSNFTVFGGEPLLAPIEHLEEVFKFGFEKFGRNSIQTNGTLITEKHIELFKRYKVGVGISIDGPADLNSARRCGDSVGTSLATSKTHDAMVALVSAGITPSLIVTLHKGNADTQEKLLRMTAWFLDLQKLGIQHVNLHILEVEKGMESLALTDDENFQAFEFLYRFSVASKFRMSPFDDITALLLEEDPRVSCIWNDCDPYTTSAVQGVSPDGTESNCGRTNKDGVNWVKADKPGRERYLVLSNTPQDHGGCKDCRFLFACKGQCPGTAIDGDWRNRTVHCSVWYRLFELIEREILITLRCPITRNPTALAKIYSRLDKEARCEGGHGDSPHGDSPHGDEHGDSPHGDHHGDSDRASSPSGVPALWKNGYDSQSQSSFGSFGQPPKQGIFGRVVSIVSLMRGIFLND